jgi:hypothetical protein
MAMDPASLIWMPMLLVALLAVHGVLWHSSLVLAYRRQQPAAAVRFLSAFKFAAGCLLPLLLVAMHQSFLAADLVRFWRGLADIDMLDFDSCTIFVLSLPLS